MYSHSKGCRGCQNNTTTQSSPSDAPNSEERVRVAVFRHTPQQFQRRDCQNLASKACNAILAIKFLGLLQYVAEDCVFDPVSLLHVVSCKLN